jgi:hypothetical protein
VLAATLVATPSPEQTDARATKGNRERGRLGTKKTEGTEKQRKATETKTIVATVFGISRAR